jgi:hypothetical protein
VAAKEGMVKVRVAAAGGVLAGVIVAAFLSTAGGLLDLALPPWSWQSLATGYLADAIEWLRATILLMPFAIVLALVNAFVCAGVFEFVIRRAGALPGMLVGVVFGSVCAAAFGLVPWAALSLSYSYMPPRAPLGPHDAAWILAALLAAGAFAGLLVGLLYGTPFHNAGDAPTTTWREVLPTSEHH